MHRLLPALALPVALAAQQPAPPKADAQVALLDRLAGHWVLRGTIGKDSTTHDVDAQWMLNREYLQLHEVSRDKDAAGAPKYEAVIYVAWDAKSGEYKVLWLDNTAQWNFREAGIGHGKPAPDRIALLFSDPSGDDHTTFAYDRAKDRWTLTIDSETKGVLKPFARTTLTRK